MLPSVQRLQSLRTIGCYFYRKKQTIAKCSVNVGTCTYMHMNTDLFALKAPVAHGAAPSVLRHVSQGRAEAPDVVGERAGVTHQQVTDIVAHVTLVLVTLQVQYEYTPQPT